MWSVLWWFVNRNSGSGAIPWPAYRGCYPEACSKWDVMINSRKLGELYRVAGMSIISVVGSPKNSNSSMASTTTLF